MNKEEIVQLIQSVCDGLANGGVLDAPIVIQDETVLIGPRTVLDSIAFVTLFMDLEERLSELTGKEIYLLIDEIHAFNPEDTFLTVQVLTDYIDRLVHQTSD